MQRVRDFIGKHRLKFVALALWIAIIFGAQQLMQANNWTFGELAEALRDILAGTWYGLLIYVAVYLARPLILFPASWLTVIAGAAAGFWLGFVYGLVAGTLSAILPYLFGRWFAGGEKTDAQDMTRLARFAGLMRRNPFQAVLTMRLVYLPYDVVSVFAGSMGIPFWAFITATALGNIGGTFTFVSLGASFQGDFATGDFSLNPLNLVFSAVVLIASLGVSWVLRKRQVEGIEKTEEIPASL